MLSPEHLALLKSEAQSHPEETVREAGWERARPALHMDHACALVWETQVLGSVKM